METQQGDTARALEITVTMDGEQLTPAPGTRVNFRGRKPDGYGIDNPATITAQNTIRYQFTEQTVACPGRFPCDVYFVQTDGTLSTVTFWLIVKPHPAGKPGTSSYEYGTMVEATNKALEAAGNASGAVEDASAAARAANEAAGLANTATHAAGEAAESANTAAQQATDAAAMAKELAEHPDEPRNGTWWRWDLEQHAYVDTGQRAVLNYDVTYHSIAEMDDDADNQVPGTVAIISTDVNIEDNAKTYVKRQDGTWGFLADLSGFPGVGIESVTLTAGDHTPGTTDTYTIKLTDGREIEVPIYNGSDGEVSLDQLTAAVETAKSRSWEVEVPASGWGPSTETWGDLTAKYEATIEVPDMTEAPEIIKIDFAGGSRAAAGRWTWIKCTAGSVTLYSTHDPAPAADFVILVTEVR